MNDPVGLTGAAKAASDLAMKALTKTPQVYFSDSKCTEKLPLVMGNSKMDYAGQTVYYEDAATAVLNKADPNSPLSSCVRMQTQQLSSGADGATSMEYTFTQGGLPVSTKLVFNTTPTLGEFRKCAAVLAPMRVAGALADRMVNERTGNSNDITLTRRCD